MGYGLENPHPSKTHISIMGTQVICQPNIYIYIQILWSYIEPEIFLSHISVTNVMVNCAGRVNCM